MTHNDSDDFQIILLNEIKKNYETVMENLLASSISTGINYLHGTEWASLGSGSKESVCNVGDLGSIPRLGRSPRGG